MSEHIVTVLSPECRSVKTQTGEMLVQKMALEVPNDFPVVFEQVVKSPLAAGKYRMSITFRTNRFQALELNPYEMHFQPFQTKG